MNNYFNNEKFEVKELDIQEAYNMAFESYMNANDNEGNPLENYFRGMGDAITSLFELNVEDVLSGKYYTNFSEDEQRGRF